MTPKFSSGPAGQCFFLLRPIRVDRVERAASPVFVEAFLAGNHLPVERRRSPAPVVHHSSSEKNPWSSGQTVLCCRCVCCSCLYRLWVRKRSQGHTCGLFFCAASRLAVGRAKLEDGRGSDEGLGT